MLTGRGIWIAFHGDALAQSGHTWVNLADRLVDHGITVLLPRAGGTTRDPGWSPTTASQVVRICHERGIKVLPWIYSVPSTWAQQVKLAEALMLNGVDGLVIDAEIEFEGHQDEAFQLGEGLRKSLGDQTFIAHAPFPYINYHLSYPYDTFAGFCDSVMPQFYFTGQSSWATMNAGATHQWTGTRAKGFAPIACTYGNDGRYPQGCVIPFRLDDIAGFDATFRDLPFRSYYSLEAASPLFWQWLKPDLGTDIGKQIALHKTGDYRGSLDGLWGSGSKAATEAFQEREHLVVDGIFGPKTAECMKSVL